jgi:hypothetical protein
VSLISTLPVKALSWAVTNVSSTAAGASLAGLTEFLLRSMVVSAVVSLAVVVMMTAVMPLLDRMVVPVGCPVRSMVRVTGDEVVVVLMMATWEMPALSV